MNKKILGLIFVINAYFCSHLAGDTPTRQLGSSSKALSLVMMGENYLKKGSSEDTYKAIELFEKAVGEISFKRLDYATQVPIYLQLAKSYVQAARFYDAEKLLLSLIHNEELKPFSVGLRLALVKFSIQQEKIDVAETQLKKLLKIHPKTLPQDERAEIAFQALRLESLYKSWLERGEVAYGQGAYLDAIQLFSKVYKAIMQGDFPKSQSKVEQRELLAKMRHRLGIANFKISHWKEAIAYLGAQDTSYLMSSPFGKALYLQDSYHLALAYKQDGAEEMALATVNDYLSLIDCQNSQAEFYNAKLLAADLAYTLKLYPEAIFHLEALEKAPQKLTPQVILLQAKIALQLEGEEKYMVAFFILSDLLKQYEIFKDREVALHLAAQCLDQMQEEFEQARNFRKELIRNFGETQYAEDAAFRLFPEIEYFLGTPLPISHLQSFVLQYPLSPYTVAARVYIGTFFLKGCIKEKNEDEKKKIQERALFEFQTAELLASSLLSEKSVPQELSSYILKMQQKALLYQGKTLLDIAAESAEKSPYLSEATLCLTAIDESDRSFYEEASYLLAKVYELTDDEELCRKQLLSLIDWMQKGEHSGGFLTKALLMLAQKEKSLELYLKAERSAQKNEELLEVWIAKAKYFLNLGELGSAITLLSKVINSDSASQLRIQAMLLRAECLEREHRHDLAIKQLEAAAKKGGEWGLEAERRLQWIQHQQHQF